MPMSKLDLHECFIKALHSKITNKRDLVDVVSDVLRIEREPASRRLCGKVNFSVREMGLLADKLNISLDILMSGKYDYQWVPFMLSYPMRNTSMDILCDIIDVDSEQICLLRPTEYGAILNSFPVEFVLYHPVLFKYLCFRWGYYFIGSNEFNDFSKWELPERLKNTKDKYEKAYSTVIKTFYLCDTSIIWTLAYEIRTLYEIGVILAADKDAIKNDIKDLLANLELHLKGIYKSEIFPSDVDFYASSTNMGFSCRYLSSGVRHSALFSINFAYSSLIYNDENYKLLKDWLISLQNISALLSKTGHLERRLFFKKQGDILDTLLG